MADTLQKKNWICAYCGFVYDVSEESISFDELPKDWTCPKCGMDKGYFEVMEDKWKV